MFVMFLLFCLIFGATMASLHVFAPKVYDEVSKKFFDFLVAMIDR